MSTQNVIDGILEDESDPEVDDIPIEDAEDDVDGGADTATAAEDEQVQNNNNKVILEPWYKLKDRDDTTLVFESRFESGNLRRAIHVGGSEYDLICKPDINTKRHTQWFYFSISNTHAGGSCKLNIINMMKPDR